jgi:hypothetical protein
VIHPSLWTRLLESVSDPAARQIIWRHLDADAVAYQDPYAMFAHFAGNSRQYDMRTIVQLDFEKCIGLFVDYRALCWNQIISCQIDLSFKICSLIFVVLDHPFL